MKAKTTWILVADGARGRLFACKGSGTSHEVTLEGEFAHDVHRDHELRTDRPGRVCERANSARHAITPRLDRSRQEKQLFVRQLAELIEEKARCKAFDRLIMVAPPQALGDLRSALGHHAQDRLAGELDKDLTEWSATDIQGRLAEAGLL